MEISMRLFFVLSLLCTFIYLHATDSEECDNADADLRISQLLPNIFYPLLVEPAIPANFVAMAPSGDVDLYDWVYWGPKDVLETYFKNPNSLENAVIRVKFSGNVAQISPDTFGNGVEEHVKQLKQADPQSVIQKRWGQYPVVAIKEKMGNKIFNIAWVGLNVPDAGWTLMFNLIYPVNHREPSKEDEALWNTFITETEPLND